MLEVLRKRRSIRRYEDRKIEDGKIELLKEAALRAPSSRGINPWRLIFVADKTTLQKLSKSMIAFGYPDEEKEPIPGEQLEYEKISGPAKIA